jgi:O-succinylbenzoate synthase
MGGDAGHAGEARTREEGGVRIEVVELRRLAMPLVAPFRTSSGTEEARDVLLVRVVGEDGEGWGECVAMNEPLYSYEYVDGAHAVTRDHLVPRLAAARDVTAEGVGPLLAAVKGHRMAKAALEMAVLDAELASRGESLASHLGAVRDSVPSGVSVGIAASTGQLLDTVGTYLERGYVRVKLKIQPGWDLEPVRAVRERFGDDLPLQVDANSAYTLADSRHLAQLDAFGLLLLEQPLPEDDIAGHAALSGMIRTPVCLDESITSSAAAADAIARGACSVVNIKAGRVGGYLEARRVHDVCAAHGIPVWCGGMLETGLGRAANLALAALPGFTVPGDISASDRYWRSDITDPFVLEDGHIRVPAGPGIGVRPDPAVLEELTTSVERVALS